MKLRYLLPVVLLLLTLTACGGGEPDTLPPTPVPPKAQRPATRTEVIMKEGMEETVTSTLVQGSGWSFYLTDGDWKEDGTDTWTAVYNDQVHLWIAAYPGQSAEDVKQTLMSDGFDEDLFKNEYTFQFAVPFDGFAFMYELPAHSEYLEGWGVTLAAMAQTFVVE